MQGIEITNIDQNRNLFMITFNKSFFNKERPITRKDIDDVVLKLFTDFNADTFHFIKEFGSGPIHDSFIGEIPESLIEDVEKITGFLPVDIYPADCKPLTNEIGCAGNMRFIVVNKEKREKESI